MSNRELNAIVFYLLDAIVKDHEIPLTSSLPEDVQEDLQFATALHKVDLSSESGIRQKLRSQLQQQAALQTGFNNMRNQPAKPVQKQVRNTRAAFLSVGLGAAAVVMAALLIFLRPAKPPAAGETAPAETRESSALEMVQQVS
jgi:hypothetical protein